LNKKRLLLKIINNPNNIKFNDFLSIVESFGFMLLRTKGSHNIYFNKDINEMINIQNFRGEAKPYQIKQFLYLVEKYNLEFGE
jgi:hypothetical protein